MLKIIAEAAWGPGTLAAFLLCGMNISIRTGFFQIIKAPFWFKSTAVAALRDKKTREHSGGVSQIQALCTTLAACVGTGNIIGVASAIINGGPGAVFWMILASIFGMMTACEENMLGVMYKTENMGGPMAYLDYAMKSKQLAKSYAVLCILCSFGIGNITQSNSAALSLKECFGVPSYISASVLCIMTALVIFGGIGRIAKASERIVPMACIIYVTASLSVIIRGASNIPSAFSQIFRGAFNFRAMRWGLSRGVFSNEAGLGTSSIISSLADTDSALKQGMWGIFSVFIDTPVMCTVTALVILCSGVYTGNTNDAAALTQRAFGTLFGSFGASFIGLCIFVFGFATIIGWCCYAQKASEYLLKNKKSYLYRIVYTSAVFMGAVSGSEAVWQLADIFNAMLAIPNLIGLFALSGKAKTELKKVLHGKLGDCPLTDGRDR